MAGIKVGAHPMVVAVAMGLLGPGVLFDEGPQRSARPRANAALEPAPEPIPEHELARVESLWHEVTLDP